MSASVPSKSTLTTGAKRYQLGPIDAHKRKALLVLAKIWGVKLSTTNDPDYTNNINGLLSDAMKATGGMSHEDVLSANVGQWWTAITGADATAPNIIKTQLLAARKLTALTDDELDRCELILENMLVSLGI